jgi:DNA repair protein RecO (recombination protein O)
MPVYTTSAIVLRRINFGETDRIITLFSREHGKLGAIAKGARKGLSRLSAATELLAYGRYQLAEGRTLDVLSQVEIKESFPRIHSDLSKIAHSTYLAELVDKMVEERDPNPNIFDLLLSTLYLMERPNDPEKITHMFELQFMKALGYEPILDKCLRCGAPQNDVAELYFSPSLGGLVCRVCGPLPEDSIPVTGEAVRAMQELISADARQVEAMQIPPAAMSQISRIMRWYIRYRAERELKSREFLDSLKLEDKGG